MECEVESEEKCLRFLSFSIQWQNFGKEGYKFINFHVAPLKTPKIRFLRFLRIGVLFQKYISSHVNIFLIESHY